MWKSVGYWIHKQLAYQDINENYCSLGLKHHQTSLQKLTKWCYKLIFVNYCPFIHLFWLSIDIKFYHYTTSVSKINIVKSFKETDYLMFTITTCFLWQAIDMTSTCRHVPVSKHAVLKLYFGTVYFASLKECTTNTKDNMKEICYYFYYSYQSIY